MIPLPRSASQLVTREADTLLRRIEMIKALLADENDPLTRELDDMKRTILEVLGQIGGKSQSPHIRRLTILG